MNFENWVFDIALKGFNKTKSIEITAIENDLRGLDEQDDIEVLGLRLSTLSMDDPQLKPKTKYSKQHSQLLLKELTDSVTNPIKESLSNMEQIEWLLSKVFTHSDKKFDENFRICFNLLFTSEENIRIIDLVQNNLQTYRKTFSNMEEIESFNAQFLFQLIS